MFGLVLIVGILQQGVVQGSSWASTIDVAGKQRMLSQRMTKEFLLVCAGMNVEANTVQLQKTMAEFESSLNDLIHGNSARKMFAAPNDIVKGRLSTVVGVWAAFSKAINDNIAAATLFGGNVDENVIAPLLDAGTGNVKVLKTSNSVVSALVDAAKASGASVSGLAVDIAGRQRMLIQRMCKEALLIRLGVSVSVNKGLLKGSIKLFDTSHSGIILGVPFAGIPALENMCTLYQMREVSYYWQQFKPLVDAIITPEDPAKNQEVALESIAEVIESAGNLKTGLFSAMVNSVKLYVNPSSDCDPLTEVNPDGSIGLNDKAWTYLLDNVGKQRMLGQKASQMFMQVANLIAVDKSKVDLIIMVDTIGRHIRSLIEGNKAQNIYAPPRQDILDQLLAAYATWTEMKAVLQSAISLAAGQLTDAQVGFLARMSENVLNQVNSAVSLYEDACIFVNSTVPARLINDAGRQRMVLMKMAKEAGLVQYGWDKAKNWQRLNETRAFFDEVHWMLLYGDTKAPGIPGTTNVCIVQQMKTIYDRYIELDSWVLRIAHGEKKDLWSSTESGRQGLLQEGFAAMHKAVGYYKNMAAVTCDALSVTAEEWEGVILGLDKLGALTEKAGTQYFLSQTGSRRLADADALIDLKAVVRKLRFGSGTDSIPAPLNQALFDNMVKLDGEFAALSNAMTTSDTGGFPTKVEGMVQSAKSLLTTYEDLASKSTTGQTLQMPRLTKISHQSVLVQRALRQAAQVRLGVGATMDDLGSTLAAFQESHGQLLNGGGGVHAVIEERPDLTEQWNAMDAAWVVFKEQVEMFAAQPPRTFGSAEYYGGSEMQIMTKAELLVGEIEKAIPLYIQKDPYVPPKPPPFPYTQIIYGIIGALFVLFICGVSFCFCRKNSGDADKQKNANHWSDMKRGNGANTKEAQKGNTKVSSNADEFAV